MFLTACSLLTATGTGICGVLTAGVGAAWKSAKSSSALLVGRTAVAGVAGVTGGGGWRCVGKGWDGCATVEDKTCL